MNPAFPMTIPSFDFEDGRSLLSPAITEETMYLGLERTPSKQLALTVTSPSISSGKTTPTQAIAVKKVGVVSPDRGGRSLVKVKHSTKKTSCQSTSQTARPTMFVEHHYHDYSNESPPSAYNSGSDYLSDDQLLVTTQLDQAVQRYTAHSKGGCTFPAILHNLLLYAEMEGYDDCISWQPHGRAFHVHDSNAFVEQVMPRFFKQTRYVRTRTIGFALLVALSSSSPKTNFSWTT
jgi:hypothetical protein